MKHLYINNSQLLSSVRNGKPRLSPAVVRIRINPKYLTPLLGCGERSDNGMDKYRI
jgi:hypothetical protein